MTAGVTKTSHGINWPLKNVTKLCHRRCTTYHNKCSECGLDLERWHNKSKMTCSPKCRKQRERRQKDAHSAYILALQEMQKMRDSVKRRESLSDFRAQLIRIRDEANDILLLANDPDAMARREMFEDIHRRKF